MSLFISENPRSFHSRLQTFDKSAFLTVLPRFKDDVAIALTSTSVLGLGVVLNGSSEEGATREARDGAVVNMLGRRVVTHFALLRRGYQRICLLNCRRRSRGLEHGVFLLHIGIGVVVLVKFLVVDVFGLALPIHPPLESFVVAHPRRGRRELTREGGGNGSGIRQR